MVKEHIQDITIFDLDNFSETLVKNYALQLLKENTRNILYIEVNENASLKSSLIFLEKIMASTPGLLVLCNRRDNLIMLLADQYSVPCHIAEQSEGIINYSKQFLAELTN